MLKSPLRYPGGKSKQLKTLLPLFPRRINEYREPFFGGGSVCFTICANRKPEKIWVNDLRRDLICFWKQVRDNNIELVENVLTLKGYFKDGRELFKFLKSEKCSTDLELATRYFILNRISFGGMVDCAGFSQSAFEGRFTEKSITSINRISKTLRNIKISNGDYRNLLGSSGKDVFIFLDPPYYKQAKHNLYHEHTKFNHEEFALTMKKCKHKWLITYDKSDMIEQLFSFAKIKNNDVTYSIGNNKKTQELIITNYEER
jgi:DNA adenine methylase